MDTQGIQILYPKLSEMLHGIGPRRIYMFTAGSGIGKSTIVHEIAHDIVQQTGEKCGVLALEEDVGEAALRHMSIEKNRPLHLMRPEKKDLDKWHEEVFGSGLWEFYDHFGSQGIDTILGKIRFMAVALECRWIVLDHISIVVSGQDTIQEADWKKLEILMTGLRSLVDETKCGLLAVVHLRRGDSKKKPLNEGGQVSLTDLKGSSSLEQLSDIVVAAERNQQGSEPNKLRLRVLKNRKAGKTGPADVLEYKPDTGRLEAADASSPFTNKLTTLPTDF
jgi:twinkle protein